MILSISLLLSFFEIYIYIYIHYINSKKNSIFKFQFLKQTKWKRKEEKKDHRSRPAEYEGWVRRSRPRHW